MTMRARRETEGGTGVQAPARRRALLGNPPAAPTQTAPAAATTAESWEYDATEVTPRPGAQAQAQAIEQATPTHIDGSVPQPPPAQAIEQATPTELMARPERSEPIRVISMKDRAGEPRTAASEPRVPLHVQLRSMAEVAGVHDAGDLGRLAPPRDARRARARRRWDNALWSGVAIALAGGIAFAIWLVAGR
jgi:hypothetical protein